MATKPQKVAVLDKEGVYMGMLPLGGKLPKDHSTVDTITECDLPPNKYRWVTHNRNEFGGEFVPLPTAVMKRRDVEQKAAADKAKGAAK